MRDLSKIKEVIKENIWWAQFGIYDCHGASGDRLECLYYSEMTSANPPKPEDEGYMIFACYEYGYFDVIGLTTEEFIEVENYYENLLGEEDGE